ncbi:unnamed protein product, partial [Closterium sp. NIES-54]
SWGSEWGWRESRWASAFPFSTKSPSRDRRSGRTTSRASPAKAPALGLPAQHGHPCNAHGKMHLPYPPFSLSPVLLSHPRPPSPYRNMAESCRFCQGTGVVVVELGGGEREESECINCTGKGAITCTTCQGTGVQPRYLDRR